MLRIAARARCLARRSATRLQRIHPRIHPRIHLGVPMRLAVLLSLALMPACASERPADAPPPLDEAMVAEAQVAAGALGGEMMSMLTGALANGGPEAAIAICADSAQARTQRFQNSGLSVHRVGTRVRNPLNAPDTFERAILDAFEASVLAGHPPADTAVMEALPGGGTRLRYLRPVILQEGCLACHGAREEISPSIRALLAERYPDDQATGYKVGELRGAVSVTIERKP